MSGEAWTPRIVVDFDGVLHSYTSGWIDAATIPDPPVEGAQVWLSMMLAAGWDVVIVSTRAREPGGAAAIAEWLGAHDFPFAPCEPSIHPHARWQITDAKPPALVYLDDRALRFDGSWPSLDDVAVAAVPWTKR